MGLDLRTFVENDIRQHPRVAYQRLLSNDELRSIVASLPVLSPFKKEFKGAISVLDWDHRLPSQVLLMRLFGYYSMRSLASGQEAFDDRLESIGERDVFPEFDVPDFDQLGADEAYEIPVYLDKKMGECRLTSSWRREIKSSDFKLATQIARDSKAFREIKAENRSRLPGLGDLEAVSWTPPCESGHETWTIDVWYLLTFDGRIGAGQSLLVDLNAKEVVTVREFSVKAG